jgi:hypothetical protein
VQLENMTAQVRPRPAWEAVDLGFLMLQRWYRPVLANWVMLTLPVFILINVLFSHKPVLVAVIFWWLLPVFDRIPLHILSRALFGELVTTRGLLHEWRSVLLPNIIKLLTVYRLDPARSYNLPVWQLEKLKGQVRANRARVLKKSLGTNALGLTFMCLIIEMIVFISLIGLVMMFLPEYYDSRRAASIFAGDKAWWTGLLINVFLYVTYLIVEPFYVAGGFSLYINRRTELEGWDIEISFRQLAQRFGAFARHIGVAMCVVAISGLVGMSYSPSVKADAAEQAAVKLESGLSNAAAKNAIQEIMNEKEFSHKRKVAGWYLKNKPQDKQTNDADKGGFNWFGLNLLGSTLAQFAQIVLWCAITAVVLLVLYYFLKWVPAKKLREQSRKREPAPRSLFGLDITPESLPEDVGAAALALWQSGKVIEALSLLYRGALTTLMYRDGINLRGSATEGDCLRIIARQTQNISQTTIQFFSTLTRQWQYAAYAHRQPDAAVMVDLCNTWGRHFSAAK